MYKNHCFSPLMHNVTKWPDTFLKYWSIKGLEVEKNILRECSQILVVAFCLVLKNLKRTRD